MMIRLMLTRQHYSNTDAIDRYDVTFDKFGNSERVQKTHVKLKAERSVKLKHT